MLGKLPKSYHYKLNTHWSHLLSCVLPLFHRQHTTHQNFLVWDTVFTMRWWGIISPTFSTYPPPTKKRKKERNFPLFLLICSGFIVGKYTMSSRHFSSSRHSFTNSDIIWESRRPSLETAAGNSKQMEVGPRGAQPLLLWDSFTPSLLLSVQWHTMG